MRTLPTSTTNMTGFRTWCRGSSLLERVDDGAPDDGRVEERAGLALRAVSAVLDGVAGRRGAASAVATQDLRGSSGCHGVFRQSRMAGCEGGEAQDCASRCSTMGPSASAGMNVSAPTMTMTPTSIADEERRVRRAAFPRSAGTIFFFASEPASARHAASSPRSARRTSRCPRVGVVEGRVRAEAGEGAAVVVRGRRERVEHLAEAVRPRVEDVPCRRPR